MHIGAAEIIQVYNWPLYSPFQYVITLYDRPKVA